MLVTVNVEPEGGLQATVGGKPELSDAVGSVQVSTVEYDPAATVVSTLGGQVDVQTGATENYQFSH